MIRRYYDSYRGPEGSDYLHVLQRWVVDEMLDKKETSIDPAEWTQVDSTGDQPIQTNDTDCGVFALMTAEYLSVGLRPSDFAQSDMERFRSRIAAQIRNLRL